jgi:hypothetical protein
MLALTNAAEPHRRGVKRRETPLTAAEEAGRQRSKPTRPPSLALRAARPDTGIGPVKKIKTAKSTQDAIQAFLASKKKPLAEGFNKDAISGVLAQAMESLAQKKANQDLNELAIQRTGISIDDIPFSVPRPKRVKVPFGPRGNGTVSELTGRAAYRFS